ncbi:Hypothetical predicted protein [Mytilus galloprovincialis]|uniref:C-type lectin domain-containing protein n=1 Tax=Mytilus galloprovincialis TaxID=29158 RepID=A0A8B6C7Y7_MYTGA|nr:Hypothetical predicted protein [Mytilus galloprovincialis]
MYTKLEVTEGGWRHYYTKDGSGRCPPADGFCKRTNRESMYPGLRYCNSGVWTFDDGTPMNYFNWNEDSQEPDGGQGYLEIMQSAGGRWHDVKKFYPAYLCLPICERR